MVKEYLFLEKDNGTGINIKGNSMVIKNMVKEHGLIMMEESMKGNSRMGKNMVKEYGLHLMEEKL